MPIEVQELVIRVEVEPKNINGGGATLSAAERQAIVAECVDRILEILREREER